MKVLFLDIDGVLNTMKNYQAYDAANKRDPDKDASLRMESRHVGLLFDEENISHLNTITDAFEDVKIVISSSWRRLYSGYGGALPFGALCKLLRRRGVKASIIGMTPRHIAGQRFSERIQRGREIKDWLSTNRHLGVTGYVVLDDDCDMDDVKTHFVRTDGYFGLTAETAKKARRILARYMRPIDVAKKLHKHSVEVQHVEEDRPGDLRGGAEAGRAVEEARPEASGCRAEATGHDGDRGDAE